MADAALELFVIEPLYGVTCTVVAYVVASALYEKLGRPSLLHPVLIAMLGLGGLLVVTGTSYESYFASARPLHLLLGPAVVLLAVPLFRHRHSIARFFGVIFATVALGSLVALAASVAPALFTNADPEMVRSLAPRAATTTVAIAISEEIGGIPGLTAVVVILSAIVGITAGPPLIRIMNIREDRAIGLALGVSAHVLGVGRAFQISEVAGVFASIGMVLNALATVALIAVLQGSF